MDEPYQPQFILPASFDAEALLPSRLRRHADDARFFVSTIIRKTVRRQVDDDGYVFLRAEHLREIMSRRHCRPIIQCLLNVPAVHRRGYAVGEHPFGYRLDERYQRDAHVRRPIQNKRLQRKLSQFATESALRAQARMKPVHRELAYRQRMLKIDGELARQIIADLPPESNPYDAQGILVADIEQGDFHLSVGNYGRVSNNITSMKREVRKALRCQGEPLVNVDISCCQPSLLALLLKVLSLQKKGENVPSYNASLSVPLPLGLSPCLPPGERWEAPICEYGELCCSNRFYDNLVAALNSIGVVLTRDEVKTKFLADVLAKKKVNDHGAEYPSPVENVFRAEFPLIYQFIRKVNGDGWEHARLIQHLQRMESWLVIEQVCDRFMRLHPGEFIVTLHDAVYLRPAALDSILAIFDDVFMNSISA